MGNIQKIEDSLRVKFKDKLLLISALTHKSADQKKNNEKLEFLGDRVLGLLLSKRGVLLVIPQVLHLVLVLLPRPLR